MGLEHNKPTRVVYAFFVLTFFPRERDGPISPEKKQVAYSPKAKSWPEIKNHNFSSDLLFAIFLDRLSADAKYLGR